MRLRYLIYSVVSLPIFKKFGFIKIKIPPQKTAYKKLRINPQFFIYFIVVFVDFVGVDFVVENLQMSLVALHLD